MVDGIIMVPKSSSIDSINQVIKKGIPIVFIDRLLKEVKCDVILSDNLNASYDAVEQLIIRGHKRIGIICGPKDIYTSQERLKGYLRVHEDYALNIEKDLILYGNYDMESGYQLLIHLIEMNNPPTAVFVTNYDMTLGAIMAINEKGIKIPDQLSIIGFDNLHLAKIVNPPLSIVVQPMKEIGEKAAHVLLSRLQGENKGEASIYRLKTEVLIKDSIKTM